MVEADVRTLRAPSGRRRAHHKAKTGCNACKSRRRKCDERKPICSGCARHSSRCSYSPRHGNLNSNHQTTTSPHGSLSGSTPNGLNFSPSSARISSTTDMNLQDLELLHQWLTFTCVATSQRPEVTLEVQRNTPVLAQKYPFLMHGIFAEAAIHLAWLRPPKRQYYSLLAAKHHGLALPEFRCTLQTVNEHNHAALIAFSFTLVWCAFARCAISSTSGPNSLAPNSVEWLPGWFLLLRGSCMLVRHSEIWIRDGPHILPRANVCSGFFRTPAHCNIVALMTDLEGLGVCPIYGKVLSALHHSFQLAWMRESNTPLRNAINYWMIRLPNEYLRALQEGEPSALVIMSYFCVLIHRSETRWFMRGHAAQLLGSILERLGDSWKHYLAWPCEEVGVQPFPAWTS